MSRKMVKLIHADGFFPNNDAENLHNLVQGLQWEIRPYGYEVPNFNLIFPDTEIFLHKVLGERVAVDVENSGVVRRPNHNAIHFEQFSSTEEWCFVVALEPTTINFWYHIDKTKEYKGDFSEIDSKNALEGCHYNFNNLFEWKIHTNILLEQNQCLFFRPWVFHSLEEGLIQYYKLLSDNNYRILIMGLPSPTRTAIADKLSKKLNAKTNILNSFKLRHENKDVDFTEDGQLRHCYRLLNLARKSTADVTIIDMTCPLPKMRQILNSDIVIWVDDTQVSQYKGLNQMFVPPVFYDLKCSNSYDETIEKIIKYMASRRK